MKSSACGVGLWAILLLLTSGVFAQDLKYLEYDTDLIPGAVCQARRDTLMQRIGKDAVAIFYSAPTRIRNADVDYLYHQDDNFYYLTGFNEENSILVLAPRGVSVRSNEDSTKTISVTEILYVQPRDPLKEQWTGRRHGAEGAMKLRGLRYATTVDKFKSMLSMMLFRGGVKSLYVPTLTSDITGEISELLQPVRDLVDQAKARHGQLELRDPSPLVYKMRIVKSPEEVAFLTKASQISATAHNQAMMSCQPGMYEYEIQAVYEYVYRRFGAEYPGYPCIVGSGENTVILHYEANRRQIKDGDLVLADCAAEYHGYSSDVTRTFPANGKFSPAQKQIYQIVLDAQTACIAMMKPGVAWRDVQAKSEDIIEEGLLNLGIIKKQGTREWRKFYMHGLGHPVGLNVHDVGQPILEAGMVYTVEPGIYIAEGAEGVEPQYYNIGVRIEDSVLVTVDGAVALSADAPREIVGIESMMKKKGIGNESMK
ncbi:MAG: aminopeptidase P N-terminal domain-containing protein [Bacteroidota bacterium]